MSVLAHRPQSSIIGRALHRISHDVKTVLYDSLNLQELSELREKNALEDNMGFRGQFEEHRRFQIEFLKKRGLLPIHSLLEIGCGPLTAGLPIIAYLDQGHYTGVDVRQSVLNLAWKEIGKAGLSAKNPRLVCSPTFASETLDDCKVDFIFSFSVLFHLDEKLLNEFFATVALRLRNNGQCFANVNVAAPSSTWLEFPFIKRTLADYQNVARLNSLQMVELGRLDNLGLNLPGAGECANIMLLFQAN
jgi:SAM-dependent methyltransferase